MEPEQDGFPDTGWERAETCWFCGKNPVDPKLSLSVEMYGNVRLDNITSNFAGRNVSYTWDKLKVSVPRCSSCAKVHDKRSCSSSFGCLPGLVALGIMIYAKIAGHPSWLPLPESTSETWLRAILIGLGIYTAFFLVWYPFGWIFGRMITPKNVKGEASKKDYYGVQNLLSRGWNFGNKPTMSEAFERK